MTSIAPRDKTRRRWKYKKKSPVIGNYYIMNVWTGKRWCGRLEPCARDPQAGHPMPELELLPMLRATQRKRVPPLIVLFYYYYISHSCFGRLLGFYKTNAMLWRLSWYEKFVFYINLSAVMFGSEPFIAEQAFFNNKSYLWMTFYNRLSAEWIVEWFKA